MILLMDFQNGSLQIEHLRLKISTILYLETFI